VISGSEELVRNTMTRFRQKVYEKAIQLRTPVEARPLRDWQAAQAAFPPSEKQKGPTLEK